MDKLSEMKVSDFSKLLGSDAPAPGGGSAAALCGSLGAALCAMVSNLTVGKKKYEEYQALAASVAQQADTLRIGFLDAIDKDTEVFNVMSAAFGMPKATDEEKQARSAAIQTALIGCTESPLYMMRLCKEAIALTDSIFGKSNASALSDLGVSALCLKAAVQGAWLNVLINLGSLKDQQKSAAFRAEGEKLLNEVCAAADSLYERTVAAL